MDQAKGEIDGPRLAYTIGANDQIFQAADYRPIIVGYKNGAPVRVGDIGDVVDGVENNSQAAWFNDQPAVIVNIQRQPGANIIEVVDRIEALLPQLKASLPPSVALSILTDRTITIRASVRDVQFELALTVVLVVMVIFFVLAQYCGHGDSQRGRTALAGGDLRGDVSVGLFAGQLITDGAHDFHGFRGR